MNGLRIRPFFLILISGCFYLATLVPFIGYGDTHESVETAFPFSISDPAGFPTYNLTAKAMTFYLWVLLRLESIFFLRFLHAWHWSFFIWPQTKILKYVFPKATPNIEKGLLFFHLYSWHSVFIFGRILWLPRCKPCIPWSYLHRWQFLFQSSRPAHFRLPGNSRLLHRLQTLFWFWRAL